jgi:RimJ/RimL family protein N-acetyltransferase
MRVELNVFSINENAIRLYENFGFAEDGRRLNAVKMRHGDYCDLVHMYKFVGD